MFRLIVCLAISVLTPCVGSAEIQYQGRLEQVDRNGSTVSVKEFSVTCIKTGDSELFYVLDESRPNLPWVEQFGTVSTSDGLLDAAGLAIGYVHLEKKYVIPVVGPYFPEHDQLQQGASWTSEQGEFEVAGLKKINGIDVWEVSAKTGIARTHKIHVRKDSPLILTAVQTVFMGPGDKFRLTLNLDSTEESETTEDQKRIISTLTAIKTSLARDPAQRFDAMTPPQVEAARSQLTNLAEIKDEAVLTGMLNQIREQVEMQSNRIQRVDGLADSMVNKEAPKFTLLNLSGEATTSSSLAGKTVVLHFWDYTDSSLEQPYGQVGYLDFLANRWDDDDVQVIGVAVNSELMDPETRVAATRRINQLKQFMKLSYEIKIDEGAVLNAFGNPTRLGEDLPLWVVLSPTGQVLHYKTGFYEVDNRVGLKVLDEIVSASVTSQDIE